MLVSPLFRLVCDSGADLGTYPPHVFAIGTVQDVFSTQRTATQIGYL
jgi:hypothetical protein